METDDLTVKRQLGSAGNMVRVMTVHGAKGLESPIVILPDCADRRAPADTMILMDDGTPLWRTNAGEAPQTLRTARDTAREAQANERLRLLYVALTRAEKWLIVAAAGEVKPEGDSWHALVAAAMTELGAAEVEMEGGTGLRLCDGRWTQPPHVEVETVPVAGAPLPDYLGRDTPDRAGPVATLSPSDLGGAKALPGADGEDEATATRRGTAIHLLLERLPSLDPALWPDAAAHLLADLDAATCDAALAEAMAVLTAPSLRAVFAAGVLAETAVSARLGARRLHGVIDRLIVTPDVVTAIDFKSNAVVPATPELCPEGILRQMAAYAIALAQVYPDRRIETAVLWTRTAQIMSLPHDLVTQAGDRLLHLDAVSLPS